MLGEPPTFSAPLNGHPQKFNAPFEDVPLLNLFDGIPQTFSTFMVKSDGWIIFLVDFDFGGPSVPTTAEFLWFSLILTRQQLWWILPKYLGRWLYFSIPGHPLVPFFSERQVAQPSGLIRTRSFSHWWCSGRCCFLSALWSFLYAETPWFRFHRRETSLYPSSRCPLRGIFRCKLSPCV